MRPHLDAPGQKCVKDHLIVEEPLLKVSVDNNDNPLILPQGRGMVDLKSF